MNDEEPNTPDGEGACEQCATHVLHLDCCNACGTLLCHRCFNRDCYTCTQREYDSEVRE